MSGAFSAIMPDTKQEVLTMPYVTTTKEDSATRSFIRTSKVIDIEAFTRDLAKALGGKIATQELTNVYGAIDLGDNTRLNLYANNWKASVDVSITATDVKHGERSVYDKAQKTVSATVNPDGRKIDAIARDIRKRVIDANAPALAAQRAYRNERHNGREQIALLAGRLKELCPSLSISKRDPDAESVSIYSGEPYVSATMDADGKVRIERMVSITMPQFVNLLALLEGAAGPVT